MNHTDARSFEASPRTRNLSAEDVDDPAVVARHEAELWRRAAGDLETARLRRHMAANVRRMSVLVPAALESAGVDVAAMMWGMRPGGDWSVQALAGTWGRNALLGSDGTWPGHGRPHGPVRRRGSFECPHPGRAAETVVAEVVGNRLELLVEGSCFLLTTVRGRARLTFDGSLPGTAATIALGRRLDQVVEHHLLRGCGFLIDRIDAMPATTSLEFKVREVHVSIPDFGKGNARAEGEG